VPGMEPRDLTPDELLSTTRTVRKRLDLTRPVERELIEECLGLAFQAPTGGNLQGWHFVLVTEPGRKKALADLYRKSKMENDPSSVPPGHERMMDASAYLAAHLREVPVLVIPCIEGRIENMPNSNPVREHPATGASTGISGSGKELLPPHCPRISRRTGRAGA
jgi:nitroreductase